VSFFLARELTTQGISLSTMGFLAVIGLVLLIVSLLLNGYLTDKLITNKRLLIIYMTITLISFIGFIIATNLIVLSFCFRKRSLAQDSWASK
jgi:MFS family permease